MSEMNTDRDGRMPTEHFHEMLAMWVKENPDMAAATLIKHCGIEALVFSDAGKRDDDQGGEDMTDPASWREGDTVKFVSGWCKDLTKNAHYRLMRVVTEPSETFIRLCDDAGDVRLTPAAEFQWIARPPSEEES